MQCVLMQRLIFVNTNTRQLIKTVTRIMWRSTAFFW
uniref:Uncharacterized protein n=1 Tax=Anguilla anguilla TaxID=7936 RepID=A0A0E9QI63_ANGAN